MSVEQRYVIHFLMLQGHGCKIIKRNLDETYGIDSAYSIDAVKYWIREWKSGRINADDEQRIGRPLTDLTEVLATFLEVEPYASTISIAKAFHVTKETIKRNLIDGLGYKKYASRWIPHELTNEQKAKRVEDSKDLLDLLLMEQEDHFENIMTGDESWFRLQYYHSYQWSPDRHSVPPRVRPDISSRKRMVTIFFTGLSCVCVDVMPHGNKFNSDYFCDNILEILKKNGRKGSKKKTLRKMKIHMDNCRIHNSRATSIKIENMKLERAPHPPYSPDISPLDFWFFGYAKGKLAGMTFDTEYELEAEIKKISEAVTKNDLFAVFNNWIKRLEYVIESRGDYYMEK